jgi:hypothetical protein
VDRVAGSLSCIWADMLVREASRFTSTNRSIGHEGLSCWYYLHEQKCYRPRTSSYHKEQRGRIEYGFGSVVSILGEISWVVSEWDFAGFCKTLAFGHLHHGKWQLELK